MACRPIYHEAARTNICASRLSHLLTNQNYQPIIVQDIKVGDILKIVKDQPFPADMVFLQSSADKGLCNIETANLDG